METPSTPTSELLANPILFIAIVLVVAAICYVLTFWITGKVNKGRERARQDHLATGGAAISSLREPMHMSERQTWAAGIALWIFVFAVMISGVSS